ncbi:small integral membrane protein 8 [Ischnura elegans]|uniref:small integral membrane protein 8 n=1 Tax=Ischnura elegans TaxID=197161 RepID=UPI001ED8BBF0|nr:small integral membrane protein 8 [Ischnura elegans]
MSQSQKQPIQQTASQHATNINPEPGEGLRSVQTTGVFRAVNFELYVKQNKGIMALGLMAFGISVGYIFYMRPKHESLAYVTVTDSEGNRVTRPKESRWDV